jgi:glyoxylase-like metal-dependent hydrolase (beta-lactamase superfamily II)/rhodanese-related sulfurtransferase
MKVEQLYTGCLAEAAYYIESNGEAVIIDPLRETAPYIERAEKDGAKIKYVLETHFHADFVSGHIDLAAKTGATIVYGPTAKPNFAAHVAEDGEELKVGNVTIVVLHTPGHTMESSTFLLRDEEGKDYAIFTGDTLFIGDVGRPDLAQKAGEITERDLAGWLFDSLREKLMPLSDDVIVYPGHGAGSACGKMMSDETFATLGHQKVNNYALRADMTREEFIDEVTDGLMPPPQYFPKNAVLNKMGYDAIDEVMAQGLTPMSPAAFETAAEATEALVLDTRSQDAFAEGFIPGSIFIGLDGNFAPWVGTLVPDLKQPILVVTEPGKEEETVLRLARVGYDNTLGYLDGGVHAWKAAGKELDHVREVEPEDLAAHFGEWSAKARMLDVRRKSEYDSQHVVGFENFPLDYINQHMAELKPSDTFYLHCKGGYRSLITASILKARGYRNLVNIRGGFDALKETGLEKTDYVCPTTLL